jgi:hypothetical protein
MTTITIPKGINTGAELVAVPRRNYEEFLVWQKKMKSVKTFKPTAKDLREIKQARKDIAAGEYLTIDELRHELGITNS